MIGILMMFIFLWGLNQENGIFKNRADTLKAHSCQAVIVKLSRRAPSTWSMKCNGNNLEVSIIKTISKENLSSEATIQQYLYREMANDLIFISKNSPSDNLERTDFIIMKTHHEVLSIHALTEGKYLSRLSTLTDSRMIAEHLKATVQVQERKN